MKARRRRGVTSTTCPSSIGITVVVRSSTAGMSEARIVSPSPTPDHQRRGDLRHRPARRGRRPSSTTSEYAPSSSRDGRADRVGERVGAAGSCSSMRCATHSVSVSDAKRVPVLLQPGAERLEVLDDAVVDHGDAPVQSRCGCALRSVGAPWVAHRV